MTSQLSMVRARPLTSSSFRYMSSQLEKTRSAEPMGSSSSVASPHLLSGL